MMSTRISIASWNVNSIKTRLPHLLQWLQDAKPDIVLLQETKTIDETFPMIEIEELGYNLAIHGQKSYNGVAILSKLPLEDIRTGLPGDATDEQARYTEAVVSTPGNVLRIASIYVPNGQSPDSDKFAYKLHFFDRLAAHTKSLLEHEEVLVLGGDYNVAPAPIDIYDPKALSGTTCFHPLEHEKFRVLEFTGLYDAFRILHPSTQQFSFWDYRGGAYQAGKGYRIDHLMLSPKALDALQECQIDETPRGWEKPSDHAPVIGYFEV